MSVVSSSIWNRTSSSSSARADSGQTALPVRLGEQVEVGAQRRQRGAQLVPGVGDELALPVARGGQRGQHRVERARQPGDLVVALDLDRVELLGAGDVLGGVGQPAHRSQAVAGDAPAGQRRGDHPGDRRRSTSPAPSVSSVDSLASSDWATTRAMPSVCVGTVATR